MDDHFTGEISMHPVYALTESQENVRIDGSTNLRNQSEDLQTARDETHDHHGSADESVGVSSKLHFIDDFDFFFSDSELIMSIFVVLNSLAVSMVHTTFCCTTFLRVHRNQNTIVFAWIAT
ncbi:hypothetical protein DICVIV_02116 [Dictyocaulus viviparus]|uniref:Uncharacterized protein n=1 Tax=Dictyocaulus viviparus TaxID=29172 RepID=A0A0D8Y4Q8_DICVI|nr:hypothetical protein DICVIV_02116 [Dictyocaulus viviparus]